MKKTAIQEVFSELEKLHPNLFNVYTTEGKEFVNHFHKYLEIEKDQICEAYAIGGSPLLGTWEYGEEYYEITFKKNQDESI
jgi:hypothetical protein